MYEHPQYLTPKGFKRNRQNPEKNTKDIIRLKTLKKFKNGIISKAGKNALKPKPISDKSARLIASAIKNMMNEK